MIWRTEEGAYTHVLGKGVQGQMWQAEECPTFSARKLAEVSVLSCVGWGNKKKVFKGPKRKAGGLQGGKTARTFGGTEGQGLRALFQYERES